MPNQKPTNSSTGPRDRPSPAWGLVENRPASFRRRRPGTQRGRWVRARRAVKGASGHGAALGRSRRPRPVAGNERNGYPAGWPGTHPQGGCGPAGSGRSRGPQFVGEFLTHGTGRLLKNPSFPRLLKKVQMPGGVTHPEGWVPGVVRGVLRTYVAAPHPSFRWVPGARGTRPEDGSQQMGPFSQPVIP